MKTDRLFTRLGIMKTKGFKTKIVMKSKRLGEFIAKVDDFFYDEDDTKVSFKRCNETVFPAEDENAETYITYIKNIKSVDRYKDEE